MHNKNASIEETPERSAESISAALDFLQKEAAAAGLTELSGLIGQAAAEAMQRSGVAPGAAAGQAVELVALCKAIVSLPAEYRQALVYRKVYGRSYQQIADDCGVSVDTAKDRVMKGFRQLRASLR